MPRLPAGNPLHLTDYDPALDRIRAAVDGTPSIELLWSFSVQNKILVPKGLALISEKSFIIEAGAKKEMPA